eukprot:s1195_g12.t2
MWIGGRKGRIGLQGGSPGNVRAHSGDLPIAPESLGAGPGRKNLYAMLLKGAGEGVAGAHLEVKPGAWKSASNFVGAQSAGVQPPRAPPPDFPPWVHIDSHLCYKASSGKTLEVIVKDISVEKGSVKIVFADNEKIWKIIPISTITSKENPLLGHALRLAVADYFELVSLMVVALLTCLLALYETLFYLEHTLGIRPLAPRSIRAFQSVRDFTCGAGGGTEMAKQAQVRRCLRFALPLALLTVLGLARSYAAIQGRDARVVGRFTVPFRGGLAHCLART